MKILIAGSIGLGGAERQMEATAAALRDLGVQVSITDAAHPDCCDCDLLHVFNAPDPELTLCRLRAGKDQSVPVALSTIYWNGYELHMQWAERGWRTAREQDGDWRQRRQRLKPLFVGADMWLPNSYAEYGMLVADFEVSRPYRMIPNAVETDFAQLPETEAPESDVLMVGRWELRKNQLGLLEALADTDYQILIIGGQNSYDREHNEAARRLAEERGNVQILPATGDRGFLASLMRNTKVLAQPSFYETPGLAALEAAACGTAVVVSERGCTREYFGDEAYYCDPTDPHSIRQAIEAALASGPSELLKERIRQEFTWAIAAQQTELAYRQLLGWISSS
ncbi:MAG: glycosyltransferase family 4 protein [Armatimonadetes bacterium]|nr:glycosyltransferase family 4 protein [Armatimonadota bacterium]